MSIKITFGGNKKVDAEINGFTVHTDQPLISGGDATAPGPYDLFLASIGTCAGIYVVGFCNSRGLSTEGIEIEEILIYDQVSRKIGKIELAIKVPPDFPKEYHSALVNSANLCAVKKTIQNPPEFEVYTVVSGE